MVTDHGDKLEALLVGQAVLTERTGAIQEDLREVKADVKDLQHRRVAVKRGWWHDKALVTAVVALLMALATTVTAWASK